MTDMEFLLLVRGPLFTAATFIMCTGIIIRIAEILFMGRKQNLAEPRGSAVTGALGTLARRMLPDAGTFQRSGFTVISGYVFHVGLFVIIFLFVPHIMVIEKTMSIGWGGLPSNIVDAATVVTMIAMIAILIHRIIDPVRRMLSRYQDYLVWVVTFLPLLTGYFAFHRVGFSGPAMLGLHILSVELFMVLLPFTSLSHAFTLWMARWYNGATAGFKGVRS